MSGTIFFICLTSAISAFSAALRISAWPAAPKRWRKGCKSRKKRTESWQSQKRRWTWSHCIDKFFDCAEYDCVEKPGDTQSTLSNSLVTYRETWRKRSKSRRSVEFSTMAKKMHFWTLVQGDMSPQKKTRNTSTILKVRKVQGNLSLQKIQESHETGEPKAMTKIGHTISIFQQIVCCTLRRFSRAWDRDMVYSYVCPSSSCRSSWGKDYTENLRSTKNQPKKSLRQLFQVTERLITNRTEITGLTTIDCQQPMWRETTLLTDRGVQFATANTYILSDSVPCLGGISDEPVEAWKNKISWYLENRNLKDLNRIDGEPMEFEWKFSQDLLHW